MKDFFQIMDEITHKIVVELQVELTHGEQVRKWYGTTSFEAWSCTAKGLGIFENYSRANNEKARELFEKAIKIDPEFTFAWVMLGWTHFIDVRMAFTKTPSESIKKGVQISKKALSIDDKNTDARALLGTIYLILRQHEKAIAEGQKSVEFGPNSALSYILLSQTLYYAGNFDEAIALAEQAVRLCPGCPAWYRIVLGRSYMLAGRYQDSLVIFKKLLKQAQGSEYVLWRVNHYLTITYSMMGQTENAQIHLAEAQNFNPKYSLELIRKINFFKDPNQLEAVLDSLRKAGLTDEPPLPLPDKPSIAVMPFVNMSGDPEQEFLSDGITESIITALSNDPELFVIARNSTFSYKGKQVKVQQVSRKLGVRYVMEGSVQKSGEQVRITARLVEAITGRHLWAEQYDRDLKDLFSLQDEIILKILTALQVKLTTGEQARTRARGTNNLKAYLKYLKAGHYFNRLNRDGNVMAQRVLKEVIALDPGYPHGYGLLAWTHLMDIYYKATKSPGKSIEKAAELAQKALILDDSLPINIDCLAYIYLLKRQHEKALAEFERAVALNPNVAFPHAWLGIALNYVGRPDDAIASFKKAIRLNPIPPAWYLQNLGRSYRMVERYEDSIATYKKVFHRTPDNLFAHAGLTATYSVAGRLDEARAQAKEVLRVQPKFSAERYGKKFPFQNKAETERLVDALRKAGLK
jgi:adenylate cyclase